MTLGVTGVVWLPRKAIGNSTMLNSGARAVPIAAAASAWSALSAAYTDATATLSRVMAELAGGLEGVNGVAALARLGGFTAWTEELAATTAAVAAKATANAAAYTTASLAMPSPAEIAAVYAAKTAAYTTGGALNGSAEAAEAAEIAMDIRAGLVMEAYEAATTALATPTEYPPAPPIANGAGSPGDVQMPGGPEALLQSPTADQVATVAGRVAGSTVSAAVSGLADAVTGAGTSLTAPPPVAEHAGISSSAAGIGGLGVAAGGAAAVPKVRSASLGASAPVPASRQLSSSVISAASVAEQPPAPQPTAARPTGHPQTGTPFIGHRLGAEDDESSRRPQQYLHTVEHFMDGRTVVPSVIGEE
ncbi:PPE domain-containing protein [Skermania sp. ID1734]|uniref:PPE domain-containing protein n=1 Tax=Skermania sp. ID1734 TaxID=2597516 RepID=UPI00117D584A|nr:PPE domain-containing protein [Skermania sp. ID1734]TSE00784.1 PPE domain-containing protein [Skermania sp. ID1734]